MAASLPIIVFNDGEAIKNNALYSLYLVATMFFYFAWQWRHGGQTLAMVTWKIKIVSIDNNRLTWTQCMIRFCLGFFGLTLLTGLADSDSKTLHDKLSKTICIKT